MAKIRVYELARELKIESKALLTKMQDLGITVPSHQSTLAVAQIEKIRASLDVANKATVVVRRRKKAEDEQPGEAVVSENLREEPSSAPPPVSLAPPVVSSYSAEVIRRRPQEAAVVAVAVASQEAQPQKIREEQGNPALQQTSKASFEHGPRMVIETEATAVESSKLGTSSIATKVVAEAEAKARKHEAAQKMADLAAQPASPPVEAVTIVAAESTPADGEDHGNRTLKSIRSPSTSKAAEVQAATPDEQASGSDMKEAPLHHEAKKAFSGATIVRRATVEERNALRAKEEVRQRTSRREDSRGVRVTGIGVKTRMEDSEPGFNKFAPPGGGTESEESRKNSSRTAKKFTTPPPKVREEEEPRPAVRGAVPQNKWRLSTRDILSVVDTDSDFDSEGFAAKKRVVYTPNQQQKRRDLKKRKDLNQTHVTTPRAAYRVVKFESPTIVVGEFARQLSVKSSEIIKKLMDLNVMATLNQSIDFDTATLLATEYGYECKLVGKTVATILQDDEQSQFGQRSRPPIVTVMGHVDHGKTSILDVIRQSQVTASEAGGITQHIGAYTVDHLGTAITFLDTPGHEAFSAMRARGSQVTDIVVLVVAADDGVMPQTKEAIAHAKNAGVPLIVAINKIDKPGSNLDRVYTELSELGVQAEEWGGDTQFVQVSALKKIGIEKLLEAIKLQAEVLELRARYEGRAEGVVLEAHLDKGVGPVATLMATHGTIVIGDYLVAGEVFGKVRMMTDFRGGKLDSASPAIPVLVIGLQAVPMAGDAINVVASEKAAKDIVKIRREKSLSSAKASVATSLEELFNTVANAEVPQVPLIVKGDTQGSVEAIVSSLEKLSTSKVKTRIVHSAVGGINESDINLAATSGALLIGFNVRTSASLATQAENKGALIKYFSIIYDVVDAVKAIMAGKLPPICTEVVQGHAEVRNAINVPKIGLIAGSAVTDGRIIRGAQLRLIRDKIVIYKGKIGSLRRFKDDVKEVQHGFECGISIEGYTDVRVGDVIEAFVIEETAAKLE